LLQFKADQAKQEKDRRWLRCEIGDDGDKVFIVHATKQMVDDAMRFGHGRALYMDATHGLQKYGLKTVTIHVKDHERRGVHFGLSPWCF
jgi:hypothetical protein